MSFHHKLNLYKYHILTALLLVVVLLWASNNSSGNDVPFATPLPTSIPTATIRATATSCINGTFTGYECIGEYSGTQTYYECVNSVWESRSRLNCSCVVNQTWENRCGNSTIENASIIQNTSEAFPTATLS